MSAVSRRIIWTAALLVGLAAAAAPAQAEKRMSDADRGELLYERHCIQCHGALAAGDGPAAADLVEPVPDLSLVLDDANRNENADIVLDGVGAMPGFSSSFDKYDAKRVMRHMERASRGELKADDEEDEEEAAPAGDPEKAGDGPDEDAPAGDGPDDDGDAPG